MTPVTPNCPEVVPTVAATQTSASSGEPVAAGTSTTPSSSTAGTSSLPFTGADVEELAVIGGVALLAGALLMRRRRTAAA
ncbi:MAG: LPXTG cell wall anchor domain-containing protein [Acidimicrobiales bacterium]|nr:LPXTG cell wall anchor domain-containing protein [Acidimicrobiales bacterium]